MPNTTFFHIRAGKQRHNGCYTGMWYQFPSLRPRLLLAHRAVELDLLRSLPFLYPAASLEWHREAKMGPSKSLPPMNSRALRVSVTFLLMELLVPGLNTRGTSAELRTWPGPLKVPAERGLRGGWSWTHAKALTQPSSCPGPWIWPFPQS